MRTAADAVRHQLFADVDVHRSEHVIHDDDVGVAVHGTCQRLGTGKQWNHKAKAASFVQLLQVKNGGATTAMETQGTCGLCSKAERGSRNAMGKAVSYDAGLLSAGDVDALLADLCLVAGGHHLQVRQHRAANTRDVPSVVL